MKKKKEKDHTQDKVASNSRGGIDDGFITAKEIPDVKVLQNPEDDPIYSDKDVFSENGVAWWPWEDL